MPSRSSSTFSRSPTSSTRPSRTSPRCRPTCARCSASSTRSSTSPRRTCPRRRSSCAAWPRCSRACTTGSRSSTPFSLTSTTTRARLRPEHGGARRPGPRGVGGPEPLLEVASSFQLVPFAADWLYRKLGHRYFWAYVAFEITSAFLICLGTVGLFALYTNTTESQFWRAFGVSCIAVAVGLVWAMRRARGLSDPLIDWVHDGKPASRALLAWRTAVALPRDFVVCNGWQPFVIIGVPIALFVTIDFKLPAYSALIIFVGICIATAYARGLHFLPSELAPR